MERSTITTEPSLTMTASRNSIRQTPMPYEAEAKYLLFGAALGSALQISPLAALPNSWTAHP
jgi:hypothetical protein